MVMELNFELDSSVEKVILDAMLEKINNIFKVSIPLIESKIKEAIILSIKETKEYQSMIGGDLYHELGITNPENRLSTIIDKIIQEISFVFQPAKIISNTIVADFTIKILRTDFSSLLSLDVSEFVSRRTSYKNEDIGVYTGVEYLVKWLEWLLLAGPEAVVVGYYYNDSSDTDSFSRTSKGIMIPNKYEAWGVPSEFAGTQFDNWLTRTIPSIISKIPQIVQLELEKANVP